MDFTLTPELTFLLGVAVFWIVLNMLDYVFQLKKHGLDVKPGYFMYRSKALNSLLDKAANKKRTLWLVFSNIGLAFSIGLMVFSIYILANNLLRFVFPHIGQAAQVALAIPVLFIRFYWLPYFLLALGIMALTHELAHGIVARLEGIPVLSTGVMGFLLFIIPPLFFVEPDEKGFEKASLLSKLRMLVSGSSINLVTALLVTLLLSALFVPSSAGILIQEVVPNGPAERAGLRQWDVITAINGRPINVPQNFSDYMSEVIPGTNVTVTMLHDNQEIRKNITTAADPNNSSRPILGIIQSFAPYRQNRLGLDQYSGIHMFWALFWIYLLGINLAIFNMLPAFPFDGEKVLYYTLANLVKKRKRELRWTLNILTWGLFVLNVALSFLIFGLRPSI